MTVKGSSHPDSAHPELLGAYVMGVVDPRERADVDTHVAACHRCSGEVAELSIVRRVLDDARHDVVVEHLSFGEDLAADSGDPADDLVLQRTLRQVRADTSRRRRSRALAVAAAVIAVGGLTGASGVVVGRATAPDPPTSTAAPPPSPGRVIQATDDETGVSMTARVTAARAWTRLSVSVEGVPPGTTCRLVAVGADGRREAAGSWIVGTPRPGAPRGTVDGSAAIAESQLDSVELLDGEGRRLLSLDA